MKAIFDATRALIPWLKTQQSETPGPDFIGEKLRQALHEFERRNRGHRGRLSDPALSPKRVRSFLPNPSAFMCDETRVETLRDTSRYLLRALSETTCEDMPETPEFTALLHAADGSGWLCENARMVLLLHWPWGMALPSGFDLDRHVVTFENGHFTIKLVIRRRTLGLTATRTLELPAQFDAPSDSLMHYWHVLRDAKRLINASLASVETWPEFERSKMDLALRNAIQSKFGAMFAGFSPEEAKWTMDHWAELVPKALRSAQRLKHAA